MSYGKIEKKHVSNELCSYRVHIVVNVIIFID